MTIDRELQDIARRTWSAGNWDKVADFIGNAGPRLLDALDVSAGMTLLDVGAGSGGSVAIPAALRGLDVTATDLVPDHFDAGRQRAAQVGVSLDWVEADALDLPFEDESFDRVTSTFGHMFAPDHARAASELVRVCKPGGRIGLACWSPQGTIGRFFALTGEFLPPPPPGFVPPVAWGSEQYVRELLAPYGLDLAFQELLNTFIDESPQHYEDFMFANFGPLVTAVEALGERADEFRAANLALYDDINQATDGTLRYEGQYLQTIAVKPT
ncbi:class I SAM-dependent methyltransferase [Jiangella gansuensis]|uniref:class I SAM-dependent methyltransferase n=1 Tax=Jiangella gansuensis TaxID=281473 RepID=UPI00047D8581|nr:class I SAM-dependent methyltransferase [Jiangella gansuensis]